MQRQRTLTLLVSLLLLTPLEGRELTFPRDTAGKVRFLGKLMEQEKGRYRLYLAESFENGTPWSPRASSSPLNDLRFLPRIPDTPPFLREKEILERYAEGTHSFRRSLFVHTSFEIPGRQNYWIRPLRPLPLRGRLARVSLWVHSQMYPHSLTLLFKNASGQEVRVEMGHLAWKGWRRLERALPPSLFIRGRIPDRFYTHKLTGILIESSPRSDPGDMALFLDNLVVLSDISEFRYDGFEIEDNWN